MLFFQITNRFRPPVYACTHRRCIILVALLDRETEVWGQTTWGIRQWTGYFISMTQFSCRKTGKDMQPRGLLEVSLALSKRQPAVLDLQTARHKDSLSVTACLLLQSWYKSLYGQCHHCCRIFFHGKTDVYLSTGFKTSLSGEGRPRMVLDFLITPELSQNRGFYLKAWGLWCYN